MYDTMARSAFSSAAFAQLVRRLRYTNARYNQIAHQCRSKQRPTHRAKHHAYLTGLRIDTLKARACPVKYVSTKPLPVIATPLSAMTNLPHLSAVDGGLLELPLTNLPDIVVAPVIPVPIKQRRVDRRQRLTIRVPPPLALNLNYGYEYVLATSSQEPTPNAPLLKPAQLPEDDSDMEVSLGFSLSSSSVGSADSFESLLTPLDLTYIAALPRGLKRKLQDVDENSTAAEVSPSHPKRIMKARWHKSQTSCSTQRHQHVRV